MDFPYYYRFLGGDMADIDWFKKRRLRFFSIAGIQGNDSKYIKSFGDKNASMHFGDHRVMNVVGFLKPQDYDYCPTA